MTLDYERAVVDLGEDDTDQPVKKSKKKSQKAE